MGVEDIDYSSVGLKCGIEIHRRLKTRKLFCNCQSLLEDESDGEFFRYLRVSKSELGEIDPAALHEFQKGRRYIYRMYRKSSCLVECDEEPPHNVNEEALRIALEIALLLDAEIVDEVHFMRKIVIDGSNTSGFQRTAMIGMDGRLKCSFGEVPITTICLEEESAQILEKGDDHVLYGLNRLGIPLIEIATAPVLDTPQKVVEAARTLGTLLRLTGKVMRGIGSIRQDVNISVKGGARIEVKGVQDLSILESLVKEEVKRQLSLIKLVEELKKREIKFSFFVDVSDVFTTSQSRIVRGKKVLAMKIEGMAGYFARELNSFRTVGREVADYVKAKTKMKGIIHTDEKLEKYRISKEEITALMKKMECSDDDLVVMVVYNSEEERGEAEKALEVVRERVLLLQQRVPEETRRALENGDTAYMRPLPGAARMYPETDVPPVFISNDLIEEMRASLPKTPEEKIKEFISLGLGKELANQLLNSDYFYLFEKAIETFSNLSAKTIAAILVNTIPEVKSREGVDVSLLSDDDILELLELLNDGKISRDSVPLIIKYCVIEGKRPETIVREKNLLKASREEIERVVDEIINEGKIPANFKAVMGEVMKKLQGRADGREVAETVKRKLQANSV